MPEDSLVHDDTLLYMLQSQLLAFDKFSRISSILLNTIYKYFLPLCLLIKNLFNRHYHIFSPLSGK